MMFVAGSRQNMHKDNNGNWRSIVRLREGRGEGERKEEEIKRKGRQRTILANKHNHLRDRK